MSTYEILKKGVSVKVTLSGMGGMGDFQHIFKHVYFTILPPTYSSGYKL